MNDIAQWIIIAILTLAVIDLRVAVRNLTEGIRIIDGGLRRGRR